jgi:hypothetical protein
MWWSLIITVAALVAIALLILFYSCCVVAGRADRQAERMLAEALRDKPAVWPSCCPICGETVAGACCCDVGRVEV